MNTIKVFFIKAFIMSIFLSGTIFAAESDTVTLKVTVDSLAPVITGFNPSSGATFYENDTILLSVVVSDTDPSPVEYQFLVDGLIKQSWSGASSYSWVTSTGDKGRHNIRIEVRDAGGEDSQEALVYIFKKPVDPPLR